MSNQKQFDIGLAITPGQNKVVQANVSANTLKAYRHATQRLAIWLQGRTLTDAELAKFIKELHNQGKSIATLNLLVSAVRWTAECHGVKDFLGPITTQMMSDIRREGKGRGRGQVTGLTWQDVKRLCTIAEASRTLAGLRDSALMNLMSDCLLRISEAVAVDVGDIQGNSLRLHETKNDRQTGGETLYVCETTRQVIRRYRRSAGIHDGALFRRVRFQQHLGEGRLSVNGARNAIKRWAMVAGVEGFISGQSLRIGSAISLARAGATVNDLQKAGRWKTPLMPAYYAREELKGHDTIAHFKDGK